MKPRQKLRARLFSGINFEPVLMSLGKLQMKRQHL